MKIISLSILAILSVIIILFVKRYNPEIAVIVALSCGVVIIMMIFPSLTDFVKKISTIVNRTSSTRQIYVLSLKCVGISIVTQFASDVCADFGNKSISSKIELAGKIAVLTLTVPYIMEILDIVINLVEQS